MRIFFGGPLTHLSNVDKLERFYTKLGDVAAKNGFDFFWAFQNGTDPNKERKISAQEVYLRDAKQLKKSDYMVAYIGEPSGGTGVEIELANKYKIPVVLMYEKNKWTSRMVRGCPSVKKELIFTSQADALSQLDTFFKSIKK